MVDKKVIEIKVFKHWQKLKIYTMSLIRYLEKRKIKSFYPKIELFMEI